MSRAFRLLHVFSTFAAAGPQGRTTEIFRGLSGDFEHTVVAMDGNFEAAEQVSAPVVLNTLPPPPRPSSLRAPLVMGHFLRAQAPDLVLTYNWGATESILGARLAGLPVVHHEDGFGTDEAAGQKRRRVWARRVLLRFVRDLVVPSFVLEDAALRDWKVRPSIVHRIPNGIDLDRFRPGDAAAARRALGLDPAVPLVGTVAKLRPEKALDLLLDAFAVLRRERPAGLLIVGDGPERGALQQRALDLGVSGDVHFLGVRPDPAPVLQALDVFALTSRTEQMPLSVVEAMGCGLPVVSTAVGDVARMVCEANRDSVLPDRDPARHAAAWARWIDDPVARGELGREQRERCVAEYDRAGMIRAYEALYRKNLPSL